MAVIRRNFVLSFSVEHLLPTVSWNMRTDKKINYLKVKLKVIMSVRSKVNSLPILRHQLLNHWAYSNKWLELKNPSPKRVFSSTKTMRCILNQILSMTIKRLTKAYKGFWPSQKRHKRSVNKNTRKNQKQEPLTTDLTVSWVFTWSKVKKANKGKVDQWTPKNDFLFI